ncbi:stage II sporulation protein P [Lysinibacillus sp. KU-BSD001]|uniref:stage II sporulation protein P n=1 Tax=Lysinibacillus sp. KU-BSD001 TaxID=3141328 RepID=UPI0036E5B228
MNNIKGFILFLSLLFLMPIIIGQLPFPNNEHLSAPVQKEQKLVYASTNPSPSPNLATTPTDKRILLVFTHSHESYKPIVKANSGTEANYDEQFNIFSLRQQMEQYFLTQGIEAKSLEVDLMAENLAQGKKIAQAYHTARPFIEKAIATEPYDLVIDFHRDSVGKKGTTLVNGDTSYAKIAFVVGMEHENYRWNLSQSEKLHAHLNELMPGISRGVMKKEGEGVDGVYNQDLAKEMILVELGGIDNTEQELTQTLDVLTEAVGKLLASE